MSSFRCGKSPHSTLRRGLAHTMQTDSRECLKQVQPAKHRVAVRQPRNASTE
jgi:hypothetical protein